MDKGPLSNFAIGASLSSHAVLKAQSVLQRYGYTVTSVEKRKLDHDLVVTGKDLPGEFKVEVKWDRYSLSTQNLYAEWWADRRLGEEGKGWAQTCNADAVFYLFSFEWAYVFNPSALRSLIQSNIQRLSAAWNNIPDRYRDRRTGKVSSKETINVVIPAGMLGGIRLREWELLFDTPLDPPQVSKPTKTKQRREPLSLEILEGSGPEPTKLNIPIDRFEPPQ